jgi:ABC-2 type transport system ATP-binding protein
MNLFEAHNITKNYAAHKALDNVSIEVKEQSIFGLLGPNGAGKTTLIRLINQITGPDEGELFINGEKLQNHHTKLIGYLPEERGLYKKMKVGEQAIYLAQLKGIPKKEAKKLLHWWFEKFDIDAWWNKKVDELSKGMQQKIQFICTVLHKPKLLIFDEPFSGFDPINTKLLKEEILKLREEGATIIFSTHNMESVEEICDSIALINKSRKILDGKMSDIKREHSTNTWELNIKGEVHPSSFLPENFQVLHKEYANNITKVNIRLPQDITSTELLKQLITKNVEITSFHEIIPSMNDIFIQKVNGANPDLNAAK